MAFQKKFVELLWFKYLGNQPVADMEKGAQRDWHSVH